MPNRLSKLFSNSQKDKEALAEAERQDSGNPSSPPTYNEAPPDYDREDVLDPPDLTAGFSNLNLSSQAKDNFPTPEECTAHLKVLECFYRLRQTVGSHDGLYGIHNSAVTGTDVRENDKTPELLAKLAEKRWAIYVQRAVDRFEKWWAAVTPAARMVTRGQLEEDGPRGKLVEPAHAGALTNPLYLDNMPPADVLMVWHAYMLNPRAYLEDCIRYGRMSLWHTKMPWSAAAACINSETFTYEAGKNARDHFLKVTSLPWDNLAEMEVKLLRCRQCDAQFSTPWTTCHEDRPPTSLGSHATLTSAIDGMLGSGKGFCDQHFSAACPICSHVHNHDRLKAAKFCKDVEKLLKKSVPMAGTVLGHDQGLPFRAFGKDERFMAYSFRTPNELLAGAKGVLPPMGRDLLPPKVFRKASTMSDIRDLVEETMKDKSYMRQIRGSVSSKMLRQERVAVRMMMSRYWENSSPFALDLVGAVVRQGVFIEKMHGLDWLHSPALINTMRRTVLKYERFMTILSNPMHKGRMAVPTLDVDLAWHTHQLAPYGYMSYTVANTKQFIDHNDKVAETVLNDSFTWTSKTYQKTFGEPYSECQCWYCEAIRESTTSSVSRLFNTANARAAAQLHGVEQDPRKSVHISAHNAVRPTDDSYMYQVNAAAKAKELDAAFDKACERARKKGRPEPKRDDYYYSDAYGYPVYIPAYSPYVGYVPYAPMYYPVNPGCMALGAGSVGNCCAGTCGGGVAAGACANGSSGGCAGGAAGGCGGGSAGGCGGGGGGGGCGGGGGGGGGGCGGGGGGGGC